MYIYIYIYTHIYTYISVDNIHVVHVKFDDGIEHIIPY